MTHNVCSRNERIARAAIGVLVLGLLFLLPNPIGWLGLFGGVLILTALFRYCPISHLLGIDTCVMKKSHS